MEDSPRENGVVYHVETNGHAAINGYREQNGHANYNGTSSMSSSTSSNGSRANKWVTLNVGGVTYKTTKDTLSRYSGTFLARLVAGDTELPTDRDESGAFLIDRDGLLFAPVINFLRTGKLIYNDGISVQGVLEEADFYNLSALSALAKDKLAEIKANDPNKMRSVYRVLQCHEDELTSVVSAVADGWKFEQLVQAGSFNYNSETPTEYLVVVSRECPDNQANIPEPELTDRVRAMQQRARREAF